MKTLERFLVGSLTLFNCGIFEPTPIDDNMLNKQTTQVGTNVPARQDLAMNLILNNYQAGAPINYTAKLQNQSEVEIILDNSKEFLVDPKGGGYVKDGWHRRAIEYRIMNGSREVVSEVNDSDFIIWLRNNGYVEQITNNDTLKTKVCNAKVNYWRTTYNIPYPLAVEKIDKKNPLTLPEGRYNFRIKVNYTKQDTAYNSEFESDFFNVGVSTSIHKEARGLKLWQIK